MTDLDLVVTFAAGEEMLTETSAKFRPDGIRAELAAVGLSVLGSWTDPRWRLRTHPRVPFLIGGSCCPSR